MTQKNKVLVVGLGYVGLPLAVRAAEVGYDVLGVDTDARKVTAIGEGRSYIEDIADHRLANPNLSVVLVEEQATLPHFDVALIAVPTPLYAGEPYLRHVEAAARLVGRALRPGNTVVLESTTHPGTTEGMVAETLQEVSGLTPAEYHLGYSPERVAPGDANFTDLIATPKLVSGIGLDALTAVQAFYATLVHRTVPVSSPRVAEMAKLYENIYAQVNIAVVNEMAPLLRRLQIDPWEMIEAANTKGHSISPWFPGPGVGGHCVPVDGVYFTWLARNRLSTTFRLGELAQEINDHQPHYVVSRLRGVVGSLAERKVLVIGVAYKPDVADLRESPALVIIEQLRDKGADVHVTDPHLRDWDTTPVVPHDELLARLEDFDAAVLVTDHAAYNFDALSSATRHLPVVDTRNRLHGDHVVRL